MSATPHDGAGTVLNLNYTSAGAGTNYTVTNIVISYTDPGATEDKIDVSHLGLTTGNSIALLDRPLAGNAASGTGRQVQFDYLGRVVVDDKATCKVTLTSGGSTIFSAVAGTVSASTLTLAVNDAIRGQATVLIAR